MSLANEHGHAPIVAIEQAGIAAVNVPRYEFGNVQEGRHVVSAARTSIADLLESSSSNDLALRSDCVVDLSPFSAGI
jgi:hypothetical protein